MEKVLLDQIKNFDLDQRYIFQDVSKDIQAFEEKFGEYDLEELERMYAQYSGNIIGGFLVESGSVRNIVLTKTGWQTGFTGGLMAQNLASMFVAYIIAKHSLN